MKKIISKFDISIPSLGLGTWDLRGRKCKNVQEFVSEALDLGYRHIDAAAMYENESEVGSGIIDSRVDREEDFFDYKN